MTSIGYHRGGQGVVLDKGIARSASRRAAELVDPGIGVLVRIGDNVHLNGGGINESSVDRTVTLGGQGLNVTRTSQVIINLEIQDLHRGILTHQLDPDGSILSRLAAILGLDPDLINRLIGAIGHLHHDRTTGIGGLIQQGQFRFHIAGIVGTGGLIKVHFLAVQLHSGDFGMVVGRLQEQRSECSRTHSAIRRRGTGRLTNHISLVNVGLILEGVGGHPILVGTLLRIAQVAVHSESNGEIAGLGDDAHRVVSALAILGHYSHQVGTPGCVIIRVLRVAGAGPAAVGRYRLAVFIAQLFHPKDGILALGGDPQSGVGIHSVEVQSVSAVLLNSSIPEIGLQRPLVLVADILQIHVAVLAHQLDGVTGIAAGRLLHATVLSLGLNIHGQSLHGHFYRVAVLEFGPGQRHRHIGQYRRNTVNLTAPVATPDFGYGGTCLVHANGSVLVDGEYLDTLHQSGILPNGHIDAVLVVLSRQDHFTTNRLALVIQIGDHHTHGPVAGHLLDHKGIILVRTVGTKLTGLDTDGVVCLILGVHVSIERIALSIHSQSLVILGMDKSPLGVKQAHGERNIALGRSHGYEQVSHTVSGFLKDQIHTILVHMDLFHCAAVLGIVHFHQGEVHAGGPHPNGVLGTVLAVQFLQRLLILLDSPTLLHATGGIPADVQLLHLTDAHGGEDPDIQPVVVNAAIVLQFTLVQIQVHGINMNNAGGRISRNVIGLIDHLQLAVVIDQRDVETRIGNVVGIRHVHFVVAVGAVGLLSLCAVGVLGVGVDGHFFDQCAGIQHIEPHLVSHSSVLLHPIHELAGGGKDVDHDIGLPILVLHIVNHLAGHIDLIGAILAKAGKDLDHVIVTHARAHIVASTVIVAHIRANIRRHFIVLTAHKLQDHDVVAVTAAHHVARNIIVAVAGAHILRLQVIGALAQTHILGRSIVQSTFAAPAHILQAHGVPAARRNCTALIAVTIAGAYILVDLSILAEINRVSLILIVHIVDADPGTIHHTSAVVSGVVLSGHHGIGRIGDVFLMDQDIGNGRAGGRYPDFQLAEFGRQVQGVLVVHRGALDRQHVIVDTVQIEDAFDADQAAGAEVPSHQYQTHDHSSRLTLDKEGHIDALATVYSSQNILIDQVPIDLLLLGRPAGQRVPIIPDGIQRTVHGSGIGADIHPTLGQNQHLAPGIGSCHLNIDAQSAGGQTLEEHIGSVADTEGFALSLAERILHAAQRAGIGLHGIGQILRLTDDMDVIESFLATLVNNLSKDPLAFLGLDLLFIDLHSDIAHMVGKGTQILKAVDGIHRREGIGTLLPQSHPAGIQAGSGTDPNFTAVHGLLTDGHTIVTGTIIIGDPFRHLYAGLDNLTVRRISGRSILLGQLGNLDKIGAGVGKDQNDVVGLLQCAAIFASGLGNHMESILALGHIQSQAGQGHLVNSLAVLGYPSLGLEIDGCIGTIIQSHIGKLVDHLEPQVHLTVFGLGNTDGVAGIHNRIGVIVAGIVHIVLTAHLTDMNTSRHGGCNDLRPQLHYHQSIYLAGIASVLRFCDDIEDIPPIDSIQLDLIGGITDIIEVLGGAGVGAGTGPIGLSLSPISSDGQNLGISLERFSGDHNGMVHTGIAHRHIVVALLAAVHSVGHCIGVGGIVAVGLLEGHGQQTQSRVGILTVNSDLLCVCPGQQLIANLEEKVHIPLVTKIVVGRGRAGVILTLAVSHGDGLVVAAGLPVVPGIAGQSRTVTHGDTDIVPH